MSKCAVCCSENLRVCSWRRQGRARGGRGAGVVLHARIVAVQHRAPEDGHGVRLNGPAASPAGVPKAPVRLRHIHESPAAFCTCLSWLQRASSRSHCHTARQDLTYPDIRAARACVIKLSRSHPAGRARARGGSWSVRVGACGGPLRSRSPASPVLYGPTAAGCRSALAAAAARLSLERT